MVRDDLTQKNENYVARKPISVEKIVAAALYKFASCAEMRIIGNNLGIGTSTVQKCIRRFTYAMLKHLTDVIYMPSEEEAKQISADFFKKCKIPQILLVIDGTHIPVLAPKEGRGEFVNRKGWASYNVQIVADVNYIIRDVNCIYPGACHDAYVFKNSGFYAHAENLIPKSAKIINGEEINYLVLGDPAYPLLEWLIKGYSGTLSPEEESFNAYMNSARIVIEQTIGKLKSRWRILKKVNEMDINFIPKVVIVCCMLHNIVERAKIVCTSDNKNHLTLPQPNIQNMNGVFSTSADAIDSRMKGLRVRNALKSLVDTYPLRQQIVMRRN